MCKFLFWIHFLIFYLYAEEIIRVKWENDFYFQSDHYYTNGFRFEYWKKPKIPTIQDFQFLLKNKITNCEKESNGFVIGQNLYTPTEIGRYYSKLGDRNYAGWLYFGSLYFIECERSVLFWEISVGTLGKNSYGEQVQKFIHRFINSDIPVGWKFQIPNSFTLQNHINYSYFYNSNFGLETSLKAGNVFASYGMGMSFRFGNIQSKTIPSLDIAESSIPPNFYYSEKYLYFRIFYWRQIYDGTLQGGNFFRKVRNSKIVESELYSYLLDSEVTTWKNLFSLDWNQENSFMGRYLRFYNLYKNYLPDNLPLNMVLFHTLFNGNSKMTKPTKNMILFTLRDKNWQETPIQEKLLYTITILNDGSVQKSNLLYIFSLQYFIENIDYLPINIEQIYLFHKWYEKNLQTQTLSFQGKAQIGFAWTIKKNLFFQFSTTISTPEFHPEPYLPQIHKWGGLQIAFQY